MRSILAALLLVCLTVPAGGSDLYWNQFRGPHGNGQSVAEDLPLDWSETENVKWKTAIHDEGWSSPVVWGNQVWVTTARDDGTKVWAVAVDLESGQIVHDLEVFDVADPQVAWEGHNTHATPTPVIEEGRIYVHFGAYGTAAIDTRTGEKLWERRDLKVDHRVRPASSPVLDGQSLLLTFDGTDAQFVVALDKRTGETLWKQSRVVVTDFAAKLRRGFAGGTRSDDGSEKTAGAEKASDGSGKPPVAKKETGGKTTEIDVDKVMKEKANDNRKSYATATVIEHDGRRQLVSPGAEVTFAYDPETGKELWRVRHEGWGWNVACRPIYAHGLVYFTEGVTRLLVAVDPSGSGDVTDTHVVWSASRGAPEISSPVIVDDLLFMVSDSGGVVTALDARTGEQVWRQRLPSRDLHWASPVAAAGRIYFSSRDGTVSVIAASREFELLATNELDGSLIASPAVAGSDLVLRTETHLYRIGQ